MEKSRPTAPPPAKQNGAAPDFGISSAPERRCKTCACFLNITNPNNPAQSQSVCRRNGVVVMMTQVHGIAGPRQEMGLSFAPTQPDLVCFDGWRPAATPPGPIDRVDW